uniref:serine hydrolase domain-containing protein n=1 Tax=Parerythrobacter lutipelagi TaxID=1964208 RepID=UPI0010F77D53|nr:serine hydrolase [Parerythrobacter lutipelagi]
MFARLSSVRSCIAVAALVPALASCGDAPADPAPLSAEAEASVIVENAGAPDDRLAREIDDMFTKDGVGETRAVVLMYGGQVVAERYAPGYDRETLFVGWSMSKTVTAAMIGMLVADGRLRLDESVPIPRWQRPGDPRGEITLRQLLQMRSGLEHDESGDPLYETSLVRMLLLDGRDDMAGWAEAQPMEAEPGARFEYSSSTTVILADIAARVLTESDDPDLRRQAVDTFLKARVFAPLAMESVVPEYDAAGTLIGGSLIHATARDWARFGDFLRNKGSYRGSQLLPRKWVELMTSPSPRSAHYGLQTWLNRPTDLTDNHPLFPDRAPQSVFAMTGHMGQYVIVSPEQRLTLVRLGHSNAEERAVLKQEAADVLALYPVR